MRSHVRVASAVLFVGLVGMFTTADGNNGWIVKDPLKKFRIDTRYCNDYVCTRTCAESTYTNGVCVEGNRQYAISIECCCCDGHSNNRRWIGG